MRRWYATAPTMADLITSHSRARAGVVLLLGASLFGGCGGGSAPASAEDLISAHITVINELADAFASVEGPAGADDVAARVEQDFVPRIEAQARRLDELRASVPEDARAAYDDDIRHALVNGLDERGTRAMVRLDERITRVVSDHRLATSALEESLFSLLAAVGTFNEALPSMAAEGGVDAAAWCREMSAKPQAEWSMDDAFAFANRCVGG